jgi:hypothetical protein
MDVVVHEAVSPNLHLVALGVLDKPLLVSPAVLRSKEGIGTSVPPVGDVVRETR